MKSAGYDPVHTPGKPMFVHRRPVARALSVVQSVVIIIYSTFLFAWILGTFLKKQAGVAFNAIVCSIFAMIIFFSLLGLYGTGYGEPKKQERLKFLQIHFTFLLIFGIFLLISSFLSLAFPVFEKYFLVVYFKPASKQLDDFTKIGSLNERIDKFLGAGKYIYILFLGAVLLISINLITNAYLMGRRQFIRTFLVFVVVMNFLVGSTLFITAITFFIIGDIPSGIMLYGLIIFVLVGIILIIIAVWGIPVRLKAKYTTMHPSDVNANSICTCIYAILLGIILLAFVGGGIFLAILLPQDPQEVGFRKSGTNVNSTLHMMFRNASIQACNDSLIVDTNRPQILVPTASYNSIQQQPINYQYPINNYEQQSNVQLNGSGLCWNIAQNLLLAYKCYPEQEEEQKEETKPEEDPKLGQINNINNNNNKISLQISSNEIANEEEEQIIDPNCLYIAPQAIAITENFIISSLVPLFEMFLIIYGAVIISIALICTSILMCCNPFIQKKKNKDMFELDEVQKEQKKNKYNKSPLQRNVAVTVRADEGVQQPVEFGGVKKDFNNFSSEYA
ncbi:MAG: hypothetical protein EZS28_026588 [Streblomastix strix]|uniref:Transmembrane protein n=1 Tax=Streblomastix strix TaxID=222440 RepID=A0A5J4V4N5_9EUKA|nr:MAG: hypothetical protein EZS28_026588 [Streblomastix strix]